MPQGVKGEQVLRVGVCMKMTIALVCLFLFLVGRTSYSAENKIVASLGNYTARQYHDCGDWQDIKVYGKYSFKSAKLENNV